MKIRKTTLTMLSLWGLLAHPLLAADAANTSNTSLLGLLQQGGWAMYPLGLTALFMFFLIFYCWRETAVTKFVPRAVLRPLSDALAARNMDQAQGIVMDAPAVLTRSLLSGLMKARPALPDANREKVEAAFVDTMEAEDSAISQWINYLNVVAAVAPMIGLLGTVSGMISAFQTIGQVGMGDPTALAGDIGEALITTATGLTIGIPAMVCYFVFRNRLSARMVQTIETGGNLIDVLAGDISEAQASQLAEGDA
jgi:biopolymer transport protein ExbB